MISINPELRDDPYYRYLMPILKVVNIGRNSNFETNLDNLKEISKSLHRDVDTIFKFIVDNIKTGSLIKKDKYIIKGKYLREDLEILIDNYIIKYVLCKSCSNPETHYETYNNELYMVCESCGKHDNICLESKTSKMILNITKK